MKKFPILFAMLFSLLLTGRLLAQIEFITTWQTDDGEITIPTFMYGYNYDVTWSNLTNTGVGDGSATGQTGNYTITGLTNGDIYQIEISGDFPRIYFSLAPTDREKIRTVEQWGDIQWASMENAFAGASYLTIEAADQPDLSIVNSMEFMFAGCTNLTGDLSTWDVSYVLRFSGMFRGTKSYSEDLSSWDVGNAIAMFKMFEESEFNGNLAGWDVSSVTDFSYMFANSAFNNNSITGWNTASATDFEGVFTNNSVFNQDISGWNTSQVTDFIKMFDNASAFNFDLNTWDVSLATDLWRMFAGATSFNGDISTWKTANVTRLRSMFDGATSYNQPMGYNAVTGAWDVSNVDEMRSIFRNATSFNQDISSWDVSSVTDMVSMFNGASSFNQDISSWNITNVTQMSYILRDATSFDQSLGSWNIANVKNAQSMLHSSGLSTENFDNTLISWTDGSFTPPSDINFLPVHLTYCAGAGARQILIDTYNWNFYLDKQSCPPTDISLTTNEIDEHNGIGSDIGELVATDTDASENFTFSFVVGTGDTDNSSFTIHKEAISQKSFLRAAEVFDFETQSAYTVRIQVEDIDGNTYEKQLSITINDIAEANPATAFTTTWVTDDTQITIPTEGTGYNYDITWTNLDNAGAGDGSATSQTGDYIITGLTNGDTYQVEITGDFPRIYFNDSPDKDKILSIENWGDIAWADMSYAFYECVNLTCNAVDAPDFTNVSDLTSMFDGCSNLNSDFNHWDVSTIDKMSSMFSGATVFNGNISDWDVSNVSMMDWMFVNTDAFNQDISGWDVSEVLRMQGMFDRALAFNQDISSWNVSKVTNMQQMFSGSNAFNQDISDWNVSNVTNMSYMFYQNTSFNQDLSTWDVSSVTTMNRMFSESIYNQPLNSWDVSSVTDMNAMFEGTTAFNQPLNNWDVSAVTTMEYMFSNNEFFNGDISTWNVSSVTEMSRMFENATSFNQDLSAWDVSSVTKMLYMFKEASSFNGDVSTWNPGSLQNAYQMFRDATAFNQDLSGWDVTSANHLAGMFSYTSLSTSNYDAILQGWAAQDVKSGVAFYSNGDITYCEAENARNTLINTYDWTINGDAKNCHLVDFITTLQTTSSGESITIPTYPALSYNYSVDWGDGSEESGLTGDATHTYTNAGTYTVKISGDFPAIYFNTSGDKDKIMSIEQWGGIQWETMENAFAGCQNLTYNAIDIPDLSGVTSMKKMFSKATVFNGDISQWDVSNITSFDYMFSYAEAFNQDIGGWDVSSATRMIAMFQASGFNQPLGNWNVSNVTIMWNMFKNANTFNQDVSGWTVSNVTDMRALFQNCTAFDQDLSSWNIQNVTDMSNMFDNSGMSLDNYDNTLTGWSSQTVQDNVTLGASGLNYCNAEDARNTLISKGWTINDAGKDCPEPIVTIPDANFKTALVADNAINTNGDAEIQVTEAEVFTGQIFISDLDISDLTGIEAFINLTQLNCNNNNITSLDLSTNTSLTNLYCLYNQLTALDVSANSSLEVLNCGHNDITSLDLSSNANLIKVYAYYNQLTSLDIANGNNQIITDFFANENPNLSCIKVSDVTHMENNITSSIGEASFSTSCNVAPTTITFSMNTIAENNSVGDVIGTFSTTDADAGDMHIYSFVSGSGDADNASFTLDENQLKAAEIFDFEIKSIYNIRLQTDDGNGGTLEEVFTIAVTDVNEAPVSLSLSANSIDENNAIADVIGTFSTSDPDTDDTHTYTLVSGTGDTDNASFTIAGADLQAAEVFDFETKASYSIRVQTDDGNGGTFEEVFTIAVTDVNEAPVSLSLSAISIDENNAVGDVIGTFSTSDPDTDDTHTYTLVSGDEDDDNASFTITGADLQAAEVFDYETKTIYSIRVETNDGNGGILESTFTVMITDVDEITDINQTSGNTAINIYPNPATEIIAVEHSGFDKAKKIYLLNLAGGVVKEQAAGEGKTSIRISEIPAGIYFIRIDSGKPNKIVIQ